MQQAAAPLVLIIDDDDDSRYLYSRLLSHRGFRTADAGDAIRGLELADALVPALVIMDYLLPGLDGWEATRRLKASALTAHIPVINVTAWSYAGIADDARAAGCDEFIEKPCDPFDVIRTVVRLIGPAADDLPLPRTMRAPFTSDVIVA